MNISIKTEQKLVNDRQGITLTEYIREK